MVLPPGRHAPGHPRRNQAQITGVTCCRGTAAVRWMGGLDLMLRQFRMED